MKTVWCVVMVILLPVWVQAQGISNPGSMQYVLDQLYHDMLPMCGKLIGVARTIGGLGTLCYIAMRVWRNIAAAEPVDLYSLLRPFVIGFCILIFPNVIALFNGILQPIVVATAAMVKDSNTVMDKYLALHNTSTWGAGALNPANWIREGIKELLELVFQAAAFIINVIRTFYLIVLAIIGPIVFALSIFDGFQHLLTVWLARYINVFLWLPVANLFGAIIAKIEENMMTASSPALPGQVFSTTDWAYIAFLLIGIVGYFTVPAVAGYIVNAGGGNALLHKVTQVTIGAGRQAASAVATGMTADAMGASANQMSNGMSEAGTSNGYFKDKLNG
ncbi:MAG: conjugative transposon protein TraJ [Chitinophagaceae bacterium]|nr:conjugative transposon protein TraJ [Chitinophagaceae bacterium]